MKTKQSAVDALISRARKIRDLAEAERALGNVEAADNFAAKMHALLLEHRLDPSTIEGDDEDFVLYRRDVDWGSWGFTERTRRNAFLERMGTVIGNAHGCRILVLSGTDSIGFVGLQESTAVCRYLLAMLRRFAEDAEARAVADYRKSPPAKVGGGARGTWSEELRSFRSSFRYAFVSRLDTRYGDLKSVASGTATGAGLMVLESDLAKVNAAITSDGTPSASPVGGEVALNVNGLRFGILAADRAPIHANGVVGGDSTLGIGE